MAAMVPAAVSARRTMPRASHGASQVVVQRSRGRSSSACSSCRRAIVEALLDLAPRSRWPGAQPALQLGRAAPARRSSPRPRSAPGRAARRRLQLEHRHPALGLDAVDLAAQRAERWPANVDVLDELAGLHPLLEALLARRTGTRGRRVSPARRSRVVAETASSSSGQALQQRRTSVPLPAPDVPGDHEYGPGHVRRP